MRKLYVLFDDQCSFCWWCRRWLQRQPTYVELNFLSQRSQLDQPPFAAALKGEAGSELIVVGDAGSVYRGPSAYIMCLWALKRYRPWASRLSRPALRPLARGAFLTIARHRRTLNAWFADADDEKLAAEFRCHEPSRCDRTGVCELHLAERSAQTSS